MTGSEWGKRRSRRRHAWKTAGAALLGLMSSCLGCQETGKHLLPDTSHRTSATTSAAGHPLRTIPTSSQAQMKIGGGTRVAPAAAFAPTGTNSGILQVGATKIVPLEERPAATTSVTSLVQALSSSEDPDGPDAKERTNVRYEAGASSTQPAGNLAVLPVNQEAESAEKKWAAAPLADGDKAGEKTRGTSEKDNAYRADRTLPSPTAGMVIPTIPSSDKVRPLTLAAALAQAGAENPVIGIALQAVQAAQAEQLQARVLLVPSVNVGGNYDAHNGPLQSSFGAIRKVDRDAVYYGLGANTLAAETIKIPGLLINTSLSDAIFSPRQARYVVANRRLRATATRNDIFLDVSTAYLNLMDAETRLAIIHQSERDFAEVARLTKIYAKRGLGRKGDADRAEADRLLLRYEELHEQQEVAIASADLAQLLNLDPSMRLVTGDIPLQVVQFVDPKVPLPKLLDVAVRNHPAILAAAANIRASQVRVRHEKWRPILPILWAGFSAGDFGGGTVATTGGNVFNPHTGNTNLAQPFDQQGGHSIPKFGLIDGRVDVDVFAYWQLTNLGMGNLGFIKRERAALGVAEAERLRVLNRVREEVSVAFNKSAENFRSIGVQRRRVQEATDGFDLDLKRTIGGEGRPIEVLDNAKRLREGREALLDAVIGFDRAQFQLFVALGQPPTLVVEDDKPPVVSGVPTGPGAPANLPQPEQLPAPKVLPLEKK